MDKEIRLYPVKFIQNQRSKSINNLTYITYSNTVGNYRKDELFAGYSWANIPSLADVSKEFLNDEDPIIDDSSSDLEEEIELAALELCQSGQTPS